MNEWFRQKRKRIAGALFIVLACVWSLTLAQPCDSHTDTVGMNGGGANHGCPHSAPAHQDNKDHQGCPDGQCSMERTDDPASVNAESVTSHEPVKLVTRLSAIDEPEATYLVAIEQTTFNTDILEPPPRLKFCTLLI